MIKKIPVLNNQKGGTIIFNLMSIFIILILTFIIINQISKSLPHHRKFEKIEENDEEACYYGKCFKNAIINCKLQGGGQNIKCYTDKIDLPYQDIIPSIPCSDYNKFDSKYGKCGSLRQGSEKCMKECISKKIKECSLEGGGHNIKCYTNKIDLPYSKIIEYIPCKDYEDFNPDWGKCGSLRQGSKKCLDSCINKQIERCKDNVYQKNCYTDKIDLPFSEISKYIPCSNYSFDPKYGKCGSLEQGGEKCLDQCIKKQVEDCKQYGAQQIKCYTDRIDLPYEKIINYIPCQDYGNYKSCYGKCGSLRQGSKKCLQSCINNKNNFCQKKGGGQNIKCYTDRIDLKYKDILNYLSCQDFGNFDPVYGKCGDLRQGDSKCKSACCNIVNDSCLEECKQNDSLDCLKDETR